MKIRFNRHEFAAAIAPLMCCVSTKVTVPAAEGILIEAKFPKLKGEVELYNIGTTIGCHSGPGTVAVFFWGQPRKD